MESNLDIEITDNIETGKEELMTVEIPENMSNNVNTEKVI